MSRLFIRYGIILYQAVAAHAGCITKAKSGCMVRPYANEAAFTAFITCDPSVPQSHPME